MQPIGGAPAFIPPLKWYQDTSGRWNDAPSCCGATIGVAVVGCRLISRSRMCSSKPPRLPGRYTEPPNAWGVLSRFADHRQRTNLDGEQIRQPELLRESRGFSFPFRSGCHDMIMGQEEFLLAFDARLLQFSKFLESPPLWLGIYWNKPVPSLHPLQGACTTRYLANNHARGQSQEEGQPKV